PDGTHQLYLNSTVMRSTGHISAQAVQMHTSIVRLETDLAAHVRDRESAVVRLEAQVSGLRNEDFVTDTPPGIANGVRSHRAHLSTVAGNRDRAGQEICRGLCLGR